MTDSPTMVGQTRLPHKEVEWNLYKKEEERFPIQAVDPSNPMRDMRRSQRAMNR